MENSVQKITPAIVSSFEEKRIINFVNDFFKRKRGYSFKMPPKKTPAIILFSGGLDSVCLSDMLMNNFKLRLYPLFCTSKKASKDYGPLQSVKFYDKYFKKKYPDLFNKVKIVKVEKRYVFFKRYSFIIDRIRRFFTKYKKIDKMEATTFQIINNLTYDYRKKEYSVTLINNPLRLIDFILKGFEYILELREKRTFVNTLFVALVPEDSVLVRESTLTSIRILNLFFSQVIGDFEIQIIAPIDKNSNFFYTKEELVKEAVANNLPVTKTWSCVNVEKNYHCGKHCFGCRAKRRIFKKLKINDDTKYYYEDTMIGKFLSFLRKYSWILRKRSNKEEKKINSKVTIRKKSKGYFSKNSFFRKRQKVIFLEMDNKGYLLNNKTGYLYKLGEIETFIFSLLEEKVSFNRLLNHLKDRYEVNEEQLKIDLKEYLLKHIKEKNIECLSK